MSVEQRDVVDYISNDRTTGDVLLTISDHLAWDDTEAHLETLVQKIAAYVGFVEDGQLLEGRPDSAGRRIVIDVVLKHSPIEEAINYFRQAKGELERRGLGFSYRVVSSGEVLSEDDQL